MSVVETTYLTGTRITVTGAMLNRVSCISKIGDNIPNVPMSAGVPLIKCQQDGGSGLYKENRLYLARSDLSGYDPVFPMHTHDPDNAFNDGGSLYDILKANSYHILDYFDPQMLTKTWYIESDEANVVVDERLNGSLYIKGTSNQVTAVNKAWNIMKGGLRLDFSYPFLFTTKLTNSADTNLVLRAGVNMALVQNTGGFQNQVGIEGCTSSSANFQVVSANGSNARTGAVLPNASLSYGSPKGYKVEYLPGDRVLFSDALGNEVSKTDALPTMNSGSDGDATLRYGLVTSNNVAKIMKIFSSRLVGKIFDTRAAIAGWL